MAFDDRTDAELLGLLSDKIARASWDFEGQKIGSALATRVCRAAASSPAIQRIVRDEGGVTQREIIDWMLRPESIFREYENMMLTRIERKSFMMSMGKAIVRAGYTKNESLSGRAFRWNLPEDVPPVELARGDGGGPPEEVALSPTKIKEEEKASNESTLVGGGGTVNIGPSDVKMEDGAEEGGEPEKRGVLL